jgi:LysR family transcriptional regulator, regulator for bpeEF and oprC
MSFNNLDELRIFNQVVASGGFTAAAAALKLPTNIVSRKIAALEKQLGVRLLHRTTRKISLTAEGKILVERATQMLRDFDLLEAELTHTRATISGVIKLAVRTTTVESGLVEALHKLLQQYPQLEVHLFVSDEPLDIVGAGIDLALMIGDLPDSSLVAKKIGDVIFCLCASPNYIKTVGSVQTIADLAQHNYIFSWQKKSNSTLVLRHKDGTLFSFAPPSRFQSNDVRARAHAVYAGIGIGALPLAEVVEQARRGKLCRVLGDYTLPIIPVWSVKSKERKDDPKLRLLEDMLQQILMKMSATELNQAPLES